MEGPKGFVCWSFFGQFLKRNHTMTHNASQLRLCFVRRHGYFWKAYVLIFQTKQRLADDEIVLPNYRKRHSWRICRLKQIRDWSAGKGLTSNLHKISTKIAGSLIEQAYLHVVNGSTICMAPWSLELTYCAWEEEGWPGYDSIVHWKKVSRQRPRSAMSWKTLEISGLKPAAPNRLADRKHCALSTQPNPHLQNRWFIGEF